MRWTWHHTDLSTIHKLHQAEATLRDTTVVILQAMHRGGGCMDVVLYRAGLRQALQLLLPKVSCFPEGPNRQPTEVPENLLLVVAGVL